MKEKSFHGIAQRSRRPFSSLEKKKPNDNDNDRFVDPLCSTCDALSSALADLPSISSSSSSSSSSRLYAVVDEFNDDCRSCCTPDADADDGASAAAAADDADDDASSSSSSSSSTAAHSAILEVSRQTLRNFRHVEEFIKHKLKGFEGRVKVRDRFGARPRIFLLDGKGKRLNSEEPVRVDHWKTEDIESFLRERLVAVAEEKKNEKKEKKKKKGGGGGGGTSTAK